MEAVNGGDVGIKMMNASFSPISAVFRYLEGANCKKTKSNQWGGKSLSTSENPTGQSCQESCTFQYFVKVHLTTFSATQHP